ncbi:MAG: hypothetical protein PHH26_06860, partial [Candidatus Thermoplasmatota archaeon]|nr:hypothetical protein [Candidatus Thermoplasmatota archaeon]
MSVNLDILRAINGLSGNPFWDLFFIIVAIVGDFLIWTFVAAPFLFFRQWRKTAILWIIASCVAGLLTLALKAIFAVPRPYETY